jgi:hypothetical protein
MIRVSRITPHQRNVIRRLVDGSVNKCSGFALPSANDFSYNMTLLARAMLRVTTSIVRLNPVIDTIRGATDILALYDTGLPSALR